MGRKDRERFQRLRETNPAYVGYRGLGIPIVQSPSLELETVVCSLCQRKRNVTTINLPEDTSEFICLGCREDPRRTL